MASSAWEEVYRAIDQGWRGSAQQSSGGRGGAAPGPGALQAIQEAVLGTLVLEYAGYVLGQELQHEVLPSFWSHFSERSEEEGNSSRYLFDSMRAALIAASARLTEVFNALGALGDVLKVPVDQVQGFQADLQKRLTALVFNTSPSHFHTWLAAFFRSTLRAWHVAFQTSHGNEDQEAMHVDGEGVEDGESYENDEDGGWEGPNQAEVQECWAALRTLGWMPQVQATVTVVLRMSIEQYLARTCKARYEETVLPQVYRWKEAVLMPWLATLLGSDTSPPGFTLQSPSSRLSENAFREWQLRHDFLVFEIFASVRIAEMFDVIREFPDSLPAVQEIKEALDITQQHRQLAASLRDSMRKRLLHNGASTTQIIDVYISTIKALRIIDPSDVLLEAVAKPIRGYLQARKDTVRCIVTNLTDENSGDLYEELRRQDAAPLEHGVDSDDEEGGPGVDWQPASRDADISHGTRRRGDILAMLISVYGSKDLFVSEYRLMLADKLLNNLEYNTDREVQNLELLKLRFGEASLHQCEIMIRDVDDSKRVNTNVQSTLRNRAESLKGEEATRAVQRSSVVDSTIVSHHYWPPLQDDELQLHPEMQERFKSYGDTYALLKLPRKLDFKVQLGTVHLELDFDGVLRPFTVTPVYATLIMHFQDKEEWTQPELEQVTGLSRDVVTKKMMLWVNQGVVHLAGKPGGVRKYTLNTLQETASVGSTPGQLEELGEEAVSSDAQEAQNVQEVTNYIMGIIQTYGGRPPKAIHDTLKIWDQRYKLKLSELERLLHRLCTEDNARLECVEGVYQLRRASLG